MNAPALKSVLWVSTLVLMPFLPLGGYAQPQGEREIAVMALRGNGATYQFALRCGLEAGLAERYKAHIEEQSRQRAAALGVDVQDEFKRGRDIGDRAFESSEIAPRRGERCLEVKGFIEKLLSTK